VPWRNRTVQCRNRTRLGSRNRRVRRPATTQPRFLGRFLATVESGELEAKSAQAKALLRDGSPRVRLAAPPVDRIHSPLGLPSWVHVGRAELS
jgi:hypothetical protein